MGGGAHQNTLGFLGGAGEYHAINQAVAGSFIKKNVFALARSNSKSVVASQFCDFISINASSVYNIFSGNNALRGFYAGNFAIFLHEAQNLAVTDNLSTVLHSAFCKGNCSTKGPAYTSTRSPQSTLNIGQVRLLLNNLVVAQNLQAFYAIFATTSHQLLQSLHFLISCCSNQGTGPFNIQVQFMLQLMVQLVTTNVGNSLQAAGRSIEACMKNSTVSFSSSQSHVRLFFNQYAFQVILGKLTQNSSTHNAATNNDYISGFYKFHSVTSLPNFLENYNSILSQIRQKKNCPKAVLSTFFLVFSKICPSRDKSVTAL